MSIMECRREARCGDCKLLNKELHGRVYWSFCVKDPRKPVRVSPKDSSCFNFIWEYTKMKNIEIPQEDFDFLKDLQHELLTQDTDGQADPRYWGILETKEAPAPYGCGEPLIYFGDGTMSFDEAKKYAEETMRIEREYDIETEEFPEDWVNLDKDDMDGFCEFCHNHFGWYETRVVWVGKKEEVAQNAMFLTKRSCQQHISNNFYHYSRPRTYAMTAWRNPEVERLLNILKSIKFNQ